MVSIDNDNPQTVSVIIPVYNSEQFLAEAIESVLAQTYPANELIIVDDGSTDRSREIAVSYPEVTYIYQSHIGVATARNRGIQESRGHYLAFLDADDVWLPDKLSLQIRAFNNDQTLEIVSGYVEQFVNQELDAPGEKKYAFPDRPLAGYLPSAILIKRSVFNKTGLFHENYQVGEAISWFSHALEMDVNLLILPNVVARRRIHGNNLSIINQNDKSSEMIRILKYLIDRKRAKKLRESDS